MVFRIVQLLWELVLDMTAVSRMTDDEKDLEILLRRQQLRIVERKQVRGPQIARWQKVPLVALATRLKQQAHHSRQALYARLLDSHLTRRLIFEPYARMAIKVPSHPPHLNPHLLCDTLIVALPPIRDYILYLVLHLSSFDGR